MTKKNVTKKVVDEKTSKKLTKEDLKEVIDEVRQETSESSPVKNIDRKFFETAQKIIISGFKDGKSEDTIKTDLFTAGIPDKITFSKIQKLYKKITLSQGLVKSAKEVKADILNFLEEVKFKETVSAWDFDALELNKRVNYNRFVPIISKAIFEVRGATERRVVSVMKNILSELNKEMPYKPKKKKLSKNERIFATIINTFFKYPKTSEESFKTVMEFTTNVKTAKKWCKMYEVFSYIALRMEKAE